MRSVRIVCALLGFILILNLHVNHAVIFRFTNVVCESHNKSWVIWENCRLKAVSRSKVILNMNATVFYPANSIRIRIVLLKKANGYKPWLFDRNVDACRFMRSRYDPFVNIVYGLFKEFGNINHSCPYVGSQLVQGFYLRPELLALPIPTGDYMLSLRWFLGMSQNPTTDTNAMNTIVDEHANLKLDNLQKFKLHSQ